MINRIKKKTIALVLASVITVAGSFAQDNYRNSIMNIAIDSGSKGDVGIILETKHPYSSEITPIRISSDTYVITLPEVNSLAKSPVLKNGVVSFDVQTRPYTTNAKGYTRIKVKLTNSQEISCSTKVYVEDMNRTNYVEEYKTEHKDVQQPPKTYSNASANSTKKALTSSQSTRDVNTVESKAEHTEKTAVQNTSVTNPNERNNANAFQEEESDYETLLLVFGILIVFVLVAAFIYKASKSMNAIAGTSVSDDETKDKKKVSKKSKKTITDTIKKLDSKYPKYMTVNSSMPQVKKIEKVNTVDLDELFNEQSKEEVASELTQRDNNDLEDFLANFDFDDAEEQIPENETVYDTELYERVINSKKIKFDKSDILRINALLNSEINENTIRNIEKYAVTSPIKDDPEKRIEDLITTFAVYQGVKFNKNDLKTLRQLVSIEIDPSFLTDLSVDKNKTEKMEKEIKEEHPVQQNIDEQPVLAIKDQLPDLSVEINNKASYVSKPSAPIEYADKTYEVNVLKLDVELPDLQDVLKNPKKYEDKPAEKTVVDEDVLLQGLSTVEFKPFDDGTREFEILNNFDDFEEDNKEDNKEESILNDMPKISDERKLEQEPKQIEEPKVERQVKKPILSEQKLPVSQKTGTATSEENLNCVFDGVSYSIISSIEYTEGVGFHLAKVGNGYAVLAYIGNNVSKIKHYDELRNTRMNFRISETLEDGTARCLLKVGYNKFVVDINGTSIKHVMDL